MTSRVGISICGTVALVVLARAAAYYAHADVLALGLVLAMGVAFVGSLVELLGRAKRAEDLTRELAALPRPATLAAVEGSSRALRPILASRIGNAGGAINGAPLAGYVVGLLVMLGLLGTFLGLFETLRGAREALTSSGDVETLRASLAAPMQGLTRSFGTSAAGVSASAMLGLAAALTRGVEARFAQALSSYAAGALVPLTVQGRQLDALERLARHGEALPRAVVALEEAASRLGSLETAWSTAHAKAAEQTSGALRDAVAEVKEELARAIARSASAAEEALAPLVTRAVDGSVAAAKEHIGAVAERLTVDLEARRAADTAHERARNEALAALAKAEETRAGKLAALWRDTTRTVDAAIATMESRGQARDAAFAQTSLALSEAAREGMDAARARLGEAEERAAANARLLDVIAKAVEARSEAAGAAAADQRSAVNALLEAAATRAEAIDAHVRTGQAEQRAAVEGLLTTAAARAEALLAAAAGRAEAIDAQMRAGHGEQRAAMDAFLAAAATRAEAVDAQARSARGEERSAVDAFLAAAAKRAEAIDAQMRAGHGEQRKAMDAFLAAAGAKAEALDSQARAGHGEQRKAMDAFLTAAGAKAEALDAQARAGRGEERAAVDTFLTAAAKRAEALDAHVRAGHELLVEEMQRGAAEHAARAAAIEGSVGAALAAQAERVVAAMEAHTRELEGRFGETATAVREAAAGVQAGGGELAAVAEMFAGAVDRHREGAAEWLTGLGTVEGAIARAAEQSAAGALAEQLDRARELYDVQLQFHRELLLQLRGIQVAAEPMRDRREAARETKEEDAPV